MLQCKKKYKAEWYKANKERMIDKRLKHVYGITLKDYDRMHAQQARTCAICLYPETAKHSVTRNLMPLSVDHCHRSGKVRGLLCQSCNQALGKFEEDPYRFERAAAYIRNGGWVDKYVRG